MEEKLVRNSDGEIVEVYGFTVTDNIFFCEGYYIDFSSDFSICHILKDSEEISSIEVTFNEKDSKINWQELAEKVREIIPKNRKIYIEDLIADFFFLGDEEFTMKYQGLF